MIRSSNHKIFLSVGFISFLAIFFGFSMLSKISSSKNRRRLNERLAFSQQKERDVSFQNYCPGKSKNIQNIINKEEKFEKYKGIGLAHKCFSKSPYSAYVSIPHDLEEHYYDILNFTKKYRRLYVQNYYKYWGPWLENAWIDYFCCNRKIEDFGGLVPLFVDWNGVFFQDGMKLNPQKVGLLEDLKKKMRTDVTYVTVVGRCTGMDDFIKPECFPNILSISGGGFGHIPVPLLQRPRFVPLLSWNPKYFISFVGSIENGPKKLRYRMVEEIQRLSKKYNFESLTYKGNDWIDIMTETTFNLVPRGVGRTSFHVYETLQMGMIPIYIYLEEDIPWIPYEGSSADLNNLGFVSTVGGLENLVKKLLELSNIEINDLRTKILGLRNSHFSFDGVMKQISLLLSGGDSDLSCTNHPKYPLSHKKKKI